MSGKTENTERTERTDRSGAGSAKKPFFKSGYYSTADINEALEKGYDEGMSAEELKRRRRRDWIFILIGVPAFIAFMYLIVTVLR